jgi:membrane protein DedA with SNARE-associated domain
MESFLSQAGLAAVFLFGFLEACCVPIPSEITFGFAGVLAGEGHFSIVAVIIVGTVAELLGSFVAYTVGRVGERPLVHKFGRYLLITHADIDRAERFFAGRGAWAVPVGRCLPVVRTFVSIVAGFIEMPALLFGVLSLIGTAVWVTAISLIGYSLSSTWQSIAHGIALAGYAIAAVAVIAIAAFVLYRLREFRKEAALASPVVAGPAASAPRSDGPAAGGRSGPRHSRTAAQDDSRTAAQDDSRTAAQDDSRTAAQDESRTAAQGDSHPAPQDDQPRPRSPMS